MAFLVYARNIENGKDVLVATGSHFSLAGHNLIYSAWVNQGRPIKRGWRVTADDLVRTYSGGQHTHDTLRLVIDYDPNSSNRIALIELLEVYLYTWDGNGPAIAGWTPMMLRMRDVFEEWYDDPLTPELKTSHISQIKDPPYGEDFIEFLYLKGDENGWNWGRNGATNAVFLHGEARNYFRQFF